jgi:hypothetical protein
VTGDWTAIIAPRLATVRRTPLRGTFIERPHRFAARCRLRGGREAEAHVPNPGRLTGVLAPGCQMSGLFACFLDCARTAGQDLSGTGINIDEVNAPVGDQEFLNLV